MSLLGALVTFVTFPGVVAHELAHEKTCDWSGVPVFEVCYFRFGNPAGYVVHAEPAKYRHAVAISLAPFAFNSILAVSAFAGLALLLPEGSSLSQIGYVEVIVCWLGLSFGMHAFPSSGDASALWGQTKSRWRRSPSALLGVPVIALIYVVNVLSALWLDLFYAIALLLLVLELFSMGVV
ncbi:metalloprotease family protein [Halovivax gelatinilyticus]|uniref:metalloprotease family protein n=1 Tax=Halovivax gelatinilyticus TaxID=2961597 RepID=UPI0020CA2B75|nr:metalloprotease family protein [Halovivax gelatinilyticus]